MSIVKIMNDKLGFYFISLLFCFGFYFYFFYSRPRQRSIICMIVIYITNVTKGMILVTGHMIM